MKVISSRAIQFSLAFSMLLITACEEDSLTYHQLNTVTDKLGNPESGGQRGGGEQDEAAYPTNDDYPYPTIIKKTFIPSYELFAHTKCLAWRIIWPAYGEGVDTDDIPTVFNTSNGALNSFNFLNGIDPQNTYKADFSLFYDTKLEAAINMWAELDYVFVPDPSMQATYFAKTNKSAATIEEWVKERPALFENYWPGGTETTFNYQEGDIFLMRLEKDNYYGGIRIVSMEPRIIEIYLAVPNP